jgi:cobalt-zinc-cadmium resistance protein CzcA
VVRELSQPSLLVDVDRDKIARYGINVADDCNFGGSGWTGGHAGHQESCSIVVRMQPNSTARHEIETCWWARPTDSRSLSQLRHFRREWRVFHLSRNNSRYATASIQHRRSRSGARREDGQAAVKEAVILLLGYRMEWGGEYSQFLKPIADVSDQPLAVVLIFMILFALYEISSFPSPSLWVWS